MTEPITLPADTVWLDSGLGVTIVQGDTNITPDSVGTAFAAVLDKGSGAGVPHLFVAPQVWAQYDKPCETCRGNGRLWRLDKDGTAESCSDCRDGRQVWTVRWPCPHSYVDRWGKRHDALHADGYLSARATIQVVPVVVSEDCVESQHENRPHLCVVGGRAIFFDGEHDVAELFLDPLPTPGRDFAVIVRLTE